LFGALSISYSPVFWFVTTLWS